MATIKLSKNLEAIIDDEDLERVSAHKWSASLCGNKHYAVRSNMVNGKRKTQYLHRFILNVTNEYNVDHININPLDNRKENLRLCTKAENNRNMKKKSTGKNKYKGVVFDDSCKNKWSARIRINGKIQCIGRYETEIEAAMAYNEQAKIHYKEFCNLNVIEDSNDKYGKISKDEQRSLGISFEKSGIQHTERDTEISATGDDKTVV